MKKRTLLYLTGLLVFLTETTLMCQKILQPEINPLNSHFRSFLIDEGRESPATYSILQDSRGFIWCGNEAGLYRFDGIRYLRYGFGESDSTLQGYTVISILEDIDGDIWAGTYGVLNYVDQHKGKVRHILPDTSDHASPDNTIRYVTQDSHGLLWIITNRHVFTFDKMNWQAKKLSTDSLAWISGYYPIFNEQVRFLEDKSGDIWIGTNNGLYRYERWNESWKKLWPEETHISDKVRHYVNCIASDPYGNLWCGTEKEGLLRIDIGDPGRVEKVALPLDSSFSRQMKNVTALFADPDGTIWTFGESYLYRIDADSGNSMSYRFDLDNKDIRYWNLEPKIDNIFKGRDNHLWMINLWNGLVFSFCAETENLQLYTTPVFVVFQSIMDRTGNLWFAAVKGNNIKLETDSLPVMSAPIESGGFASSSHKALMATNADKAMTICLNNGYYKIEKIDPLSAVKPVRLDIPGVDPDIPEFGLSVFIDSKSNSWYGCSNGVIVRYDQPGNHFRKYTLPVKTGVQEYGQTMVIQEDSYGSIWFATYSDGVFVLRSESDRITQYIAYDELLAAETETFLLDFLVDSEDKLWISIVEGLFSITPKGRVVTDYTGFDKTGRTIGNIYLRIAEDLDRKIWVLNSQKGPYVLNRNSDEFERFPIDLQSSWSDYTDMLFDSMGKLWIARFGQITVIDLIDRHTRQVPIPVKAFESASLVHPQGYIIYVVADRLLVLPEKMPVNRYIPPVFITALHINGREYPLGTRAGDRIDAPFQRQIVLPHYQNNIVVEFAALNYTDPEHNRYRYFMSGIDSDTLEAGPGADPEYRDLRPGRYHFWVTGSNNDGIWNPDGVSLDIRIHPPWYRTGIAWLLYIISLIALISLYVRQRISHLETERARLAVEVERQTLELEKKNRDLAEADRIKTRFFTDISHEIRTPLSLITGPLDDLSHDEMLTDKQFHLTEMMARNARRLMILVNQLLDISRLDAGKMKLTLVYDDIVKYLRILVYEYLSVAETRHIKYIADLPDNRYITWFDRDKTEMIISNLLSNAFKYTPPHGIVNCIIRITDDNSNPPVSLLMIRVIDSGPGIVKEHQENIFERFFRADDRHETEAHGSGIGLSLVREFTTLLHGEIKLISEPGSGAQFDVTIPLGRDHLTPDEYITVQVNGDVMTKGTPVEVKKKQMPEPPMMTEAARMKILIIEDNDDLRHYIRESLTDDYAILEAENGRSGLNLALTMMPDLILTDIMMPDLDGIELCEKLKNDDHTSHIPIIMLTARATAAEKLEGLQSGADDYIVKPFDMSELRQRISNQLVMLQRLRQKYSRPFLMKPIAEKEYSNDERFLLKVVKIINDNIHDFSFDAGKLHEIIGMSRMHLTRKLKILTGMSPATLIRNIRLERAAEMIIARSGNITEIANSVGISNPSGFTRAFRNYFGVSPKSYGKK